MSATSSAIGVFDSGVGGLTVLRALRARLPAENYLYLGDTARLPYGTKSPETVTRYAVQCAQVLAARRIKLLVVACNTASAVAIEPLREAFPGLPVIGVIEPGAARAVAMTRTGHVAVIATEGTVRGGTYERALLALRPTLTVTQRACPLFVALAEEGWSDGPIAEAVARRYLEPLFTSPSTLESGVPDTLVLGCTHFPALRQPIERIVGAGVAIVDSAVTTAEVVARELASRGLAAAGGIGSVRLLATDGPERFARVGTHFSGEPVAASDVELVDLAPRG